MRATGSSTRADRRTNISSISMAPGSVLTGTYAQIVSPLDAAPTQRVELLAEQRRLVGPNGVGDATAGRQQLFPQRGPCSRLPCPNDDSRSFPLPYANSSEHAGRYGVSAMSRPEIPIPFTAIVPAAGLGTRFLPATKTVPKELLPVVDTPGIELVAAEAAEAGAERLVIITSEGKDSVVAHFVEDLVLEGTLEARGKEVMLAKVRRAPALIKVESVVQAEPLGLGHAIGCVEAVLAPDEDAVMVLLPDDLVLPTGVLETMAKVRAKLAARCCVPSR